MDNIISVAVTCFNQDNKILKLISSLNKQSLKHDRLLIDDCSPAVISPQGWDYYIRNLENKGYISNRNTLAKLCKTKYICFLDDDVVLDDPDFLDKAISELEQNSGAAVLAIPQVESNGKLSAFQPSRVFGKSKIHQYYGWAHVFRTDIFNELGGYDPLIFLPYTIPFYPESRKKNAYGGEEGDLSLKVLGAGYDIIYDSDLSVVHNESSANKNYAWRRTLGAKNAIFTIIIRYPISVLSFELIKALLWQAKSPKRFIYIILCILCGLSLLRRKRSPISLNAFKTYKALAAKPIITSASQI